MTKTRNRSILITMVAIAVLAAIGYLTISVNMKYFEYAMSLRVPKLLAMAIAAYCIGTASIVFQSVINNRIVTPCLLGMNSLYILIHTSVVFVLGSTSVLVMNKNLAFAVDLLLMGVVATTMYGYLFRKTKYNVLYVLLAGTVLANLFGSLTNTMMRVMDPNEYMTLQDSMIASFSNANSDVIMLSLVLIVLVKVVLWKDIKLLDVITLGKNQAINLGVDYDRTISRLLIGVTLYIAIATALVGPISFLGLIVANISRQLLKTYKHTYLMLGSALIGIIILIGGQILIEHVFNYTTTISVFINLFGGIYFLYLILKSKGS